MRAAKARDIDWDAKRNRRSKVRLRVVCFVGVVSLPLFVSLVRNYQWERSQPPTIVVPNLIGLPLITGTERAHSVHHNKSLGAHMVHQSVARADGLSAKRQYSHLDSHPEHRPNSAS